MSTLGPQQQNVSYDGILQIPGGVTAQLQQVQDGEGRGTGLFLSSAGTNATTADSFTASIDGTSVTGAVPRLISDGFGDYLSVKDFGAVGDGVTDDTDAIQTAILSAKNSGVPGVSTGKTLFFPAGTYCITGLIVYPYQHLVFDPSAILKMTASGIAIRSSSIESQTKPTGNIRRIILDGVRIDMDSHAGFGVLLECCTNAVISNAWIVNVGYVPFSYSDGYDPVGTLYASTGVVLKGIPSIWGSYYNKLNSCRIESLTDANNAGVWFGTSLTGSTARGNFNQISQIVCYGLATGIDIALGGDNLLIQPEMSSCKVGIRVGSNSFVNNSRRNWIQQVYLENCTTAGVQLRSTADDTVLQGFGSTSGTTTIIDDSGTTTSIFAANTDSIAVNGYVRPYYGSIRFPSVPIPDADVNALDDYKEGTFLPAITCLGTAPDSVVYDQQNGSYTKIGRLVVVQINLKWTSMTGSPAGQMAIIDLPYSPQNIATVSIFPQSGCAGTGAFLNGIAVSDNGGTILLHRFDGTVNYNWNYDPAAHIRVTLSYFD